MTSKFSPGDAVRLNLAHPHSPAAEAPLRRVVWTHPDAGVTVERVDGSDRVRVEETDVVFADPMLQCFRYGHLSGALQEVSHRFSIMAHGLVFMLPDNLMREIALLKLAEAKDAAVRARIWE